LVGGGTGGCPPQVPAANAPPGPGGPPGHQTAKNRSQDVIPENLRPARTIRAHDQHCSRRPPIFRNDGLVPVLGLVPRLLGFSPVPSVETSLSAPAESFSSDLRPQCARASAPGQQLCTRDRAGTALPRCARSRLTLVSTLTLPARRRPSVMERMSMLAAVVSAASATATLYLFCFASSNSALL
jgi:hypothetical protein